MPQTFEAAILERVETLRNDFSNGSSVIARNAFQIIKDLASLPESENHRNFIIGIARQLYEAKPNMAAPKKLMAICIHELKNAAPQKSLRNFIDELEFKVDSATSNCIEAALQVLPFKDRTNIITSSFSSTVFSIFKSATKNINIYALESNWRDVDYGKMMFEKCRGYGINTVYLTANDLDKELDIDFALTGADAILSNGSVINGVPSLFLANKMKEIEIPLFVAGESFKKSNEIAPEDGFELIPAELISKIISDNVF